MPELHGKGWRVAGYFIWMLGAGVVLDSGALGAGLMILTVGGALFGHGVVQSMRGAGGGG
ncbi:MAG: hypothetical protein ABI629_24615 [bacterium]